MNVLVQPIPTLIDTLTLLLTIGEPILTIGKSENPFMYPDALHSVVSLLETKNQDLLESSANLSVSLKALREYSADQKHYFLSSELVSLESLIDDLKRMTSFLADFTHIGTTIAPKKDGKR